jgi:hypothetical protein
VYLRAVAGRKDKGKLTENGGQENGEAMQPNPKRGRGLLTGS